MKGVLPPAGFNNAIFHLLPKKETGLISDTRPLSVSNTYNRIIASVIKNAIQESLLSFLNRDQCGFWPGRNMEENLDYFNELFYKALDEQEEYSMFLFDIAKAFDSVSHKTIHTILKHVGLPTSFCNAIKGLFHEITLTTNFKGGTNQSFNVRSGIKQGCPLSPLLFIVVMDVLHHFLKKFSEADVKLYCDDTAAGDKNIASKIKGIKEAFTLFEACTGLTLNLTKTVLLTTLAPSKRTDIRRSLDENGWKDINIAEQSIYLGIPFGRPPGAVINSAYNDRIKKFTGRMVLYAKHKGTLSTAKRILLINVFALPLLSYPFRFFLIPNNQGNVLRSDIDGLLNKNCSFKTMAYTARQTDMGVRNGSVLLDYWVQNLAALASRTTSDQIDNHPIRTNIIKSIKGKRKLVRVLNTWSLRFRTNRAIAVHWIEENYDIPREDFLGKTQSDIYKIITNSMPYRLSPIEYHKKSLRNWDIGDKGASLLFANHNKVPQWIPDYALFHHLHIVHKAIPTSSRLTTIFRHATERGSKTLPHISSILPCFLCGKGEDSLEHIFRYCQVTREANTTVHQLLGTMRGTTITTEKDLIKITFALPEDYKTESKISVDTKQMKTLRTDDPSNMGTRRSTRILSRTNTVEQQYTPDHLTTTSTPPSPSTPPPPSKLSPVHPTSPISSLTNCTPSPPPTPSPPYPHHPLLLHHNSLN